MDISKLKGTGVYNEKLFTGIIIDTEEKGDQKYIIVRFDMSKSVSRFAYPDAFEKHLEACSYQREIRDDIKEAAKQARKKAEDKAKVAEEKQKESSETPKQNKSRAKQLNKNGSTDKRPIRRRSTTTEGDCFCKIVDIHNQCFGKSYPEFRRSYVDIGNNYYVWCPKLAIYKAGGFRAADKKYGCINIIEQNGDVILEGNENPAVAEKDYGPYSEKRAAFMHKKDGFYHFLGVYEYAGFDKARKYRIHKRVAKTLDLSAWN